MSSPATWRRSTWALVAWTAFCGLWAIVGLDTVSVVGIGIAAPLVLLVWAVGVVGLVLVWLSR